jgi:LytS/YehU family sensor histidine kinase
MNIADSDNSQIYHVVLFTLIPFVVGFSFIVFIFYRKRRESLFKQTTAELNQQVVEVEMKALRSQINPHFIFNCMNSVQEFMEKNDVKSAREYLEKFSKLIRMVLENSVHKEVSLKKDLDALCLYMQMEQVRMSNRFDFQIKIDSAIDGENTVVPPLILQPFVENSIKHGLSGKSTRGTLTIRAIRESEMLKFIIDDDGIESTGQEKKETRFSDVKKTSLGLSLTRERLEVLNKTKNTNASFTLSDIRDADNNYKGKRVELFLPYEEAI